MCNLFFLIKVLYDIVSDNNPLAQIPNCLLLSSSFSNIIWNNSYSLSSNISSDFEEAYEKIKLIKHVDSYSHIILVFSEYWKEHLIKIGIDENKIKLLYHGFDNNL